MYISDKSRHCLGQNKLASLEATFVSNNDRVPGQVTGEKCRIMILPQPQNPPAILYNTIFDCERILRIVRRFFGLQSRLRIRNPLQSPRNPPNPLAIHYNQDCEHLSQSYTIQRIPTQSIKIIRGLCLWLQYLCRARQCYNPRGKSVSRQGLNHQGRCTIKTATFECFHIL